MYSTNEPLSETAVQGLSSGSGRQFAFAVVGKTWKTLSFGAYTGSGVEWLGPQGFPARDPVIRELNDGRFMLQYTDREPGAPLVAKIFDPRTAAVDWTGDGIGQQYAGTKFGDRLSGGGGNDTLFGHDGNDVLEGGDGSDRLHGGEGWDLATYINTPAAQGGVTVDLSNSANNAGAAAGDVLIDIESVQGTNAADRLVSIDRGNGIGAELHGAGGADVLIGKAGGDRLYGEAGDDILEGGDGGDILDGGEGWDLVTYINTLLTQGGVTVDLSNNANNGGAAFGDTLVDVEVVQGTSAADRLVSIDRGNGIGAELHGAGGSDTLVGKGGGDRLYGEAGSDILEGGDGGDILDGGAGWDVVTYINTPAAQGGVTVDLSNNANNGGAALGDTLVDIEVVQGTNANDTITGIDRGGGNGVQLYGEGGHDWLIGKGGGDMLVGGTGNDTLDGGGAGDVLDGGDGVDIADYASAGQGVRANLLSPSLNTGDAAGDVYKSIEGLSGSQFSDELTGDSGSNRLMGRAGNDTLDGGGGTDTAVFAGAIAGYTIIDNHDGTFTVTGQDGTDLLKNMEFAQFDDLTVSLTSGTINNNPDSLSFTDGSVAVETNDALIAPALGTLKATDPDMGQTLVFAIDPSDTNQGLFTIRDGNVLAVSSGRLTAGIYTVKVQVSDGSGGVLVKDFEITTTHVEQPPVIDGLSSAQIAEDAAPSTVVGVFAAHDPEQTGLLFELKDELGNDADAGGQFSVDPTTGLLRVAQDLPDGTGNQTFQVTLKVSDKNGGLGSLASYQTFTITVTDVVNGNHAPDTLQLNGGTTVTIYENSTFAGNLSAHDTDNDSDFVWTFDDTVADNANQLFEIDNSGTGNKLLRLKAGVDFEALPADQKFLTVAVRASDGKPGGESATQIFRIAIADVNEAPDTIRLNAATTVTIPDNAGTGLEVGALTAHDPEGKAVTFALSDSADGRFMLDATQTKILVADGAKLDGGATFYDIKVVATDADHQSTEQVIRIALGDTRSPNRAPVGLGLSLEHAPSEYAASGTVVGTLTASDPDGDPLTYALLDNAGGRFKLIGNQLVVDNGFLFDYEQAGGHEIRVQASDGRGGVVSEIFTIGVSNIDPEITSGTAGADVFHGGVMNDRLYGGAGNDRLFGGGGRDIVKGQAGNDTLGGGAGKDKLYGGKGKFSKDMFVFDTKLTSTRVANKNVDKIYDFGPKYDSLGFDDLAFTNRTIAKYVKNKGGATLDHKLKIDRHWFRVGDKALDRNDFFIYNDKTHKLYFDVDGSGNKAMVEVASFAAFERKTGLTLTWKDFFLI